MKKHPPHLTYLPPALVVRQEFRQLTFPGTDDPAIAVDDQEVEHSGGVGGEAVGADRQVDVVHEMVLVDAFQGYPEPLNIRTTIDRLGHPLLFVVESDEFGVVLDPHAIVVRRGGKE